MQTLSKKAENLLLIIWVQAFVATTGSLFYSEVMGYIPCELCWYQRILMYPLVIIYGLALWKKDVKMTLAGLILSGIGMFVSTYHYLLQKVPALHEVGGSCSGAVPCNAIYVNYLGFITIPFMAGVAFIVIFVLHLLLVKEMRRN
ncbi:disulfide oxidoreductase [Oceanobacillus alkalisoli]|uniref:disulfide oxidoreductase n=1 Tax=Oceanobacillus alkalisoli TaxID=2925113 RepID=UPI001EF12437|nr:disulfide oxidoreductase [Oceanobacillus alkalisoli]MCF3942036.1 disulfide oxidoreductase [Oceanobacillus alkalisoli]MCG5102011.1 disulfide oxidoreductase [Oceanobacillus alkalisoli]